MSYSRENREMINRVRRNLNILNKEFDEQINILNDKITTYEWQSYNGTGNNLKNPSLGSTNINLLRKGTETRTDSPNPRVVSNLICKLIKREDNELNLTDLVWVWGQFLDHELTHTPNTEETKNITTDSNDPNEDYPNRTIPFKVSTDKNSISSFIDATNVYGFHYDRALYLRRLDGTGKLKTTNNLLPLNEAKLENASLPGMNSEELFIAGDIRSNENVLLTSIHTVFVREHNRLCDLIISAYPNLEEEIIFQRARKIVISIMQKITFEEFLPVIFGTNNLPAYRGYNSNLNPGINTEFSTIGFRLGHSMLSSKIGESLSLKDAFFNPSYVKENGIDQLLLDASKAKMKKIDHQIIDDVRNFLFGPPTATILHDLATLNIQRGRDQRIPGYNKVRESYGLQKKTFAQITSNTDIQTKLESLYQSPDNIDPWVGMLCEDHVEGSAVGELTMTILKEQFSRLRDGDRFWYQNQELKEFDLNIINNSRLEQVINRNTNLSINNSFIL
jgi:hypothetical protein